MPVLFPFLFGIGWVTILKLLSWAGGWHRLAGRWARPPAPTQVPLQSMGGVSGSLGWVNYKSCLWLQLYPQALRLGVMLPFRIGHPTLWIPREEILALEIREGWFGFHSVLLKFEGASMKLLMRQGAALQDWWQRSEPSPGLNSTPSHTL